MAVSDCNTYDCVFPPCLFVTLNYSCVASSTAPNLLSSFMFYSRWMFCLILEPPATREMRGDLVR